MTPPRTHSLSELEAMAVYSVLVAGKSAEFAEAKTRTLLAGALEGETPFEFIRKAAGCDMLAWHLKVSRTGSYGRLLKCFPALAKLDVRTCTVADLEAIHGIGPKTARFFILWTRPNERLAALDRHVLHYLSDLGHDVPKSTPSSRKRYTALEAIFLAKADELGKSPRDLDLEVWESYRAENLRMRKPNSRWERPHDHLPDAGNMVGASCDDGRANPLHGHPHQDCGCCSGCGSRVGHAGSDLRLVGVRP